MEISPEERKTISEESKARIGRKAQITDNRTGSSQHTSAGLAPNIEAFLCYLGAWVTGIVVSHHRTKECQCAVPRGPMEPGLRPAFSCGMDFRVDTRVWMGAISWCVDYSSGAMDSPA